MNHLKYRKDIDALRGVAVLLVVIFHAFPNILPGGFIGVDVFFVISGYLITNIIYDKLKKDEFSFLYFYKRRIRRIFPALFTVLLASLAVGWFILFPDEYKQLGNHVSQATVFIQNFSLIKELGYFDVSGHYKPLLHLWTLSIEEQYYLFWPAILILICRFKLNVFIVLIFIILISFLANIYFVKDYKDEVFFHSITRSWELGIGSLLAIYLYGNHQRVTISNNISSLYVFIIGLSLILYSAFWANKESFYPYWIGLFPTIGTALIIIANLKLRSWAGLVGLGLISYPLYLWHWVIISFCYIYLGKKPSTSTLFMAITMSLLLSYLTFKYIEKIRHTESNKIIIGVILVSMFVGIGGFLIANSDGMPNRRQLDYIEDLKIEFDRIPSTDELCGSYIESIINENEVFSYCRASLIDKNRKLIAIIGDSHASVFYSGISSMANEYEFDTIMIANSSCPPLVQFMWGRNDKEIKDCQFKINQMIRILQLDKRIEKVVIATRGPVYIHGEVKGKFTNTSVKNSLDEIKNPDSQTYETYFSGFEETLNQLSKIPHVKAIYYLLENPELDFLPKEVIPRPYDHWGISIQDSTIDRSLYRLRMKKYRELVYDKSSNLSKVHIIDLEPYLCEGNKCFAFKNGNFLYADDDHFSVFGSHYIARKVENILFDK